MLSETRSCGERVVQPRPPVLDRAARCVADRAHTNQPGVSVPVPPLRQPLSVPWPGRRIGGYAVDVLRATRGRDSGEKGRAAEVGSGVKPEDAEEYTQALGQVLAGGWRQRALAWRLGVPQALGMSLEEWTERRLGGYVRQSIPERQEAVAELDSEGYEPEAIAAIVGASRATVYRDLDAVSPETEDPEPLPLDVQPRADEATPSVSGETETKEPLRPSVNDGDEWYTPRWLFDALGIKFSIDVCAPLDLTHTAVPAELHLNVDDDGLAQPWHGTVWCNPPYSKPEPWARRLIHHRDGLLLTHMPMNAGWCVDTWEACDAIRLFQAMEFVRPDGSVQRPGYWLQLAAFGTVATEALARLQPLGDAAANKRRIASPMWRRAA